MKSLLLLATVLVLNGCVSNSEPTPTPNVKFTPVSIDIEYDDVPEEYPVNNWNTDDALSGNTYNRANDVMYRGKVEAAKTDYDPNSTYRQQIKGN